ncbi:MAG: helix-turn-helix transcriptional regulator [Oscillospiraceae bacterium]|nr:helix-turn-helix transcriptional regulator [Oscillospiraceae bacterium]
MDYHKRLRELRIEHGYTQEQIAYILHTRQEQYSKYENGKRDLPIKHLIALCCLYRVSADYVLGIEKVINKTGVIQN